MKEPQRRGRRAGTGGATAGKRAQGGRGNVSDVRCCRHAKQDKGGKNTLGLRCNQKNKPTSWLQPVLAHCRGAQNPISPSPEESIWSPNSGLSGGDSTSLCGLKVLMCWEREGPFARTISRGCGRILLWKKMCMSDSGAHRAAGSDQVLGVYGNGWRASEGPQGPSLGEHRAGREHSLQSPCVGLTQAWALKGPELLPRLRIRAQPSLAKLKSVVISFY